jgi:hypothetical protein
MAIGGVPPPDVLIASAAAGGSNAPSDERLLNALVTGRENRTTLLADLGNGRAIKLQTSDQFEAGTRLRLAILTAANSARILTAVSPSGQRLPLQPSQAIGIQFVPPDGATVLPATASNTGASPAPPAPTGGNQTTSGASASPNPAPGTPVTPTVSGRPVSPTLPGSTGPRPAATGSLPSALPASPVLSAATNPATRGVAANLAYQTQLNASQPPSGSPTNSPGSMPARPLTPAPATLAPAATVISKATPTGEAGRSPNIAPSARAGGCRHDASGDSDPGTDGRAFCVGPGNCCDKSRIDH